MASRWRGLARPIVRAALEALPPGAGEKEARAALRPLYPFGERAHHPYRMWCAEVNAQLEAFGLSRSRARQKKAPVVGLVFVRNFRRPLWLDVRCDWCGDRVKGGCMVCVGLRRKVPAAAEEAEFAGLREAAEEDAALEGVLGDWCEEHLGDRCGLP